MRGVAVAEEQEVPPGIIHMETLGGIEILPALQQEAFVRAHIGRHGIFEIRSHGDRRLRKAGGKAPPGQCGEAEPQQEGGRRARKLEQPPSCGAQGSAAEGRFDIFPGEGGNDGRRQDGQYHHQGFVAAQRKELRHPHEDEDRPVPEIERV